MSSKIRILTVDDDPDIRELLRLLLEKRGYQVEEAASGQQALERLRSGRAFDLVILDIMMPGVDGVETCQTIRGFSAVPILFLTARSQLHDKTEAYQSGGDDFLTKPFSGAELMLKVESLLRRYRVYKGKQELVRDIKLELDEDRHNVIKNGQEVELTAKEFEILQYFFLHRGKTVSVKSMYESVWGEQYMTTSTNTVMVHVVNLRKKLEEDPANPKLIRTVWGKGYQFG